MLSSLPWTFLYQLALPNVSAWASSPLAWIFLPFLSAGHPWATFPGLFTVTTQPWYRSGPMRGFAPCGHAVVGWLPFCLRSFKSLRATMLKKIPPPS